MTTEEKLIVSAYTGILMTHWGEFHEYAETRLGRPIWTHGFASEEIVNELKEAVREDFLRLCAE